jgi:hypothetical protein
VLVAQPRDERAALYLAANGCTVTAVEPEADIVARVIKVAEENGLATRVQMLQTGLNAFAPTAPYAAVVCSSAALVGLTARERARVLGVLQRATADGGVHLVETIAAGTAKLDMDELRKSYKGWVVSVEGDPTKRDQTFVARKE